MGASTLEVEGLPFTKMSASGNDFILINNFEGLVPAEEAPRLASRLCRRALSVGADGLILIEPARGGADFAWRFFNADGSEAEMCGNGGRCAARFAVAEGLAGEELAFETLAGTIRARVSGRRVRVQLPTPRDLRLGLRLEVEGEELTLHAVNTGVPHAVLLTEELDEAPVTRLGRAVRHHGAFAPAGTNVNFVRVDGPRRLAIRTYERGVEDETLACGTGATAAAVVARALGLVQDPVEVVTRSGEVLSISFGQGEEVFLEGEARFVYRGTLSREATEY